MREGWGKQLKEVSARTSYIPLEPPTLSQKRPFLIPLSEALKGSPPKSSRQTLRPATATTYPEDPAPLLCERFRPPGLRSACATWQEAPRTAA
jgi:hypothetical protein